MQHTNADDQLTNKNRPRFESLNGGIWKIGDKAERGGAFSTKSGPTEATKVSPHEADWTQAAGRTTVWPWKVDSTAAALRTFQAKEDKKKMDMMSGDEQLAFKQQRDDEADERNEVDFTITLTLHQRYVVPPLVPPPPHITTHAPHNTCVL